MTDAVPRWSSAVVAEAFRVEIRTRLEAHNAAYRACAEAELEQVLRDHPEIVAPGPLIDLDLVHLFDNTTMAWSKPWVEAAIIDRARAPRSSAAGVGAVSVTQRLVFVQSDRWCKRFAGTDSGGSVYDEGLCAYCARPVRPDASRLRGGPRDGLEAP